MILRANFKTRHRTLCVPERNRVSRPTANGVFAILLLLISAPTLAHHSFAMFDKSKKTKIEGVVQEFQWTNPHTYIRVLATQNGEAKRWLIETGAPGSLQRLDPRWKGDIIKPGDKVTIIFYPLKSGEAGGALIDLTTPAGLILGQHRPNTGSP